MSDKLFGVVMYVIMAPVIIVMAAMLCNETKPKKNIVLGVTLPYSARDDAQALDICAGFRRRVWYLAALLAVVGAPMLFIRYVSVQITVFMLWILAVIALPYAAYVKTHLELKTLKRERGWFLRRESAGEETVVDMSVAAAPPKRLSGWWFVPPFVISLVPVVLALTIHRDEQATAFVIIGLAFAATVVLSAVLYPIIFRLRTDVAGTDSAVNSALTNVRRAAWGRAWIYIAWSTSLTGLFAWIFRSSELGQLITILAYTFILLRLCVWTEMGLRRAQEELTAKVNADYVDEDEHWPLGIFYNNPNDRHLTVNDRVGMNMTVNLARPAGKALMGLTVLLLVCMPLIGVWMMGVEFSPRRLELTEERVELIHLTRRFELELDDIFSAELLEELPRTWRVNGMGMDTLREGKFTVEGYGSCEICLDPRESPFIVLKTDDKTYIFNAETPEETSAAFAEIRRETNA